MSVAREIESDTHRLVTVTGIKGVLNCLPHKSLRWAVHGFIGEILMYRIPSRRMVAWIALDKVPLKHGYIPTSCFHICDPCCRRSLGIM
jgi:hypothetical protein